MYYNTTLQRYYAIILSWITLLVVPPFQSAQVFQAKLCQWRGREEEGVTPVDSHYSRKPCCFQQPGLAQAQSDPLGQTSSSLVSFPPGCSLFWLSLTFQFFQKYLYILLTCHLRCLQMQAPEAAVWKSAAIYLLTYQKNPDVDSSMLV